MRNLLTFIALLGLVPPLLAQEQPVATVSFEHVALSVADADRSAAFYRDVFGLEEITNRTEVAGIRWFSFGQGKELHLISVIHEPVMLNKAVHFALTTSGFDGFLDTLRRQEIAFTSWAGDDGQVTVRADGTRQIYIQDPDGYWIEVNSAASDR